MSIEKVRAYLRGLGMEERIREFSVSSATVALAAQALGVEEARIAKSLTFRKNEGVLMVVAAGDAKVDNARFKAAFGVKAKMLPAGEVETLVGHPAGGVCPFDVNEGVEVCLDVSLRRFDTVFPAAGSANSAVTLTCDELARCAGTERWVDVCKAWRPEEAS